MRIALCFSGQHRSFKEGFKYYQKNLLMQHEVDVYIHTWSSNDVMELKSLYNPVSIVIENPKNWDADTKYTNTPNVQKWPPRFTMSMFYSMYQVRNLLNSTGREYDWVIRTRTDYALNLNIPFETLDDTKLYIPNCRMVPSRDFGNDQFAFGSQDTMLKYMYTFKNLDKYYNEGNQFIGEDMMRANLREHNLVGEKLVYCDMKNPFPPGPHNGTWHSLIRDDYEQWTKDS